MPTIITTRSITDADRAWLARFPLERWGSERMVRLGELIHVAKHDGFLALRLGEPVGIVTYQIVGPSCEITLLDAGERRQGIGSALIEAVKRHAREAGCERLWLITTNDNVDALRFYQRRGTRLARLYPDSVVAARRLKPEIPLVGEYGIPLRDEIELEMRLGAGENGRPEIDTLRSPSSGSQHMVS